MVSIESRAVPTARARFLNWCRALGVIAGCGAGMMVLISCVSPPAESGLPLELPSAFSTSGTAVLPDKWWTAFADEQLNAAIEEALSANFSLQAAWDRLDQAWALAAKSGAGRWPSVDGSAGLSRSTSASSGSSRTSATEYALGLSASYEVDLWGRVRATRQAAHLDALATTEDLHTAAMTLSAEIANTWVELTEARGQLRLIHEQLKTNTDYLEIITLRFRRGQASATDVLQQRQLVQATEGEHVNANSAVDVLEHQLAVLLGRSPGELALAIPEALPSVPILPDAGVPAEWLCRRPDLRAAGLRVQAADRELAAALADRFPTVALSLKGEASDKQLRDLFDNWLASLAASLTAPLVDGGSRRGEVRRTRAAASAALNSYAQAVLSALQDVEDALALEARQGEYVASLERQLTLSASATDQTRENYMLSGADFTRYLTTLVAHHKLQRTYLASRRQRVQYRIELYRALGGGWPLSRAGAAAPPGQPTQGSSD